MDWVVALPGWAQWIGFLVLCGSTATAVYKAGQHDGARKNGFVKFSDFRLCQKVRDEKLDDMKDTVRAELGEVHTKVNEVGKTAAKTQGMVETILSIKLKENGG